MVEPSAVRDLLEERPDLEPAVERALAADDPFTFEDVDVDSGRFGELVDAGIVAKTEDGYVVADRAAVARGLGGGVTGTDGDRSSTRSLDLSLATATPGANVLGGLAAAVAFVVVLRLVPLPNVFQDGAVVLSGNDPYHYRYWVEQLVLEQAGPLSTLPDGVTTEEPLFVVTLWFVAELFGGTKAAVGSVMPWYPVVSAAVTSGLLYLLAVETTGDRRVGIAAVVMLAVVPGHAVQTSLGFADHHAFDGLWLVLTALALVVLLRAEGRSRRALLGTVGLGLAVAGQVLAWWAAPLLQIPMGVVVLAGAVLAGRAGDSPARAMAPTLGGIALGAAVVLGAHVGLGWHTRVVALSPLLLLGGSLAVVAILELGRRYGLDDRYALACIVGTGVLAVGAVAVVWPEFATRAVGSFTGRLFQEGGIGETRGLFTSSVGWLLWFGFGLPLAVPYLVWGTAKLVEDPRWTVPVAYGWYLLALAALQVRFVGEFAPFASLFAGLGVVHLAERVGVARRPAPFDDSDPIDGVSLPVGSDLRSLFLLLLMITGLGILQVPIQSYQTTTPPEQYRTAAWMADYSAERGWTYPENYVFSRWSDNRIYNYFVSGESRSYRYARQRYSEFLGSSQPERSYERLRDRAGFVVYSDEDAGQGDVARALAAYGSRTDAGPGLGHYRAVHVSENAGYKVFVLVEGATVAGTAQPDTVVTLRSEQSLDGRTFVYERRVRTDSDGRYAVTVAYPGEYTVDGTAVEVTEEAVASGGNVTVDG